VLKILEKGIMLSEREREVISHCAQKYNVASVLLFGSSLEKDSEANDIDIGIKGIKPALFFKFYGELIKNLPRPVDVVDLSRKTLFTQMIEKNGIRIYG
jgi:predicted nucleotidyltransferase